MFLKTQLSWTVSVPASSLDSEGSNLQKAILTRLLDDFATKKASKDIGYFLAVTTLDRIGQGIISRDSGEIQFPVDFTCITFKMFAGEILDGVVHMVMKHGVFLRCGPADKVYLSFKKMEDYEFVPGETPFFKKVGEDEDGKSRIEKGMTLRFSVIAEKYDEAEKDFKALVGLEGDCLGPIS
ncbi:DNA-directed RNA polymerase v subunit 7 [Phtheirospermum japonicum]|uniref:DNA-directed RNA polymerase subunit n=1 Tax=Phtheirospermum japonicum TaxID=374723 RepID=A0A830CC58_9LAMI|nr:DNA-directed RNA polymerase v subunit 7 [Phtheirospermum japonicum]